ncbi:hypothetical protein Acr_26g0000620 [Actinidia rufa]|uniref:Uncharacterized protein n=1 Tax=Actinidia rufa TaxID=165716 RepID=A0A7J0H171_9ERIC|nr:hypothetical protein Acr_26g0000620 [Actinidia rufa]
MSACRRPWRDCLPPPSHHPWPIGAPARPVDGSQSKEEAFRSQIDPHRCRIEPRQGDSPPLCKIPATKVGISVTLTWNFEGECGANETGQGCGCRF